MKATNKKVFSTLLCIFSIVQLLIAQKAFRYDYTLNDSKNLDLVIQDLSEDYGFQFSYPSEIIGARKLDKQRFQSDDLDTFLKLIFNTADLEFKVIENFKILLRPDRSLDPDLIDALKVPAITIKGYLQDQLGKPLPFVDVALDTLYLGSSTNDLGYFEFEVPGYCIDNDLSFHLIGYKTKSLPVSTFMDYPKLTLESMAFDLQEVLVVEQIPAIDINPVKSSSTGDVDFLSDITSASLLSNDIIRGVQFLAGVEATNDLSSEIKIRGSQGDETLIMLDGIPIYKADHYYGIFGAVNGNFVNTVSLHKNNMPVQYGGKTGGMLEMRSKEYFQDSEGIADANMLTSSLTVSAPLDNQWSITASARTTYDNAANSKIFGWIEPNPEQEIVNEFVENSDRPLILQTSPVVQFYDLNAKLLYRPNDQNNLSLSFFNGKDKFRNNYDIGFEAALGAGRIEGLEIYDDAEDWSNLGFAINYIGKTMDNWTLSANGHYTSYDYNSTLSTSINLKGAIQNQFAVLSNSQSNDIADVGASISLTKDFGNSQFTVGLSGVKHNLNFFFKTDDVIRFNTDLDATEGALFSNYNWNITDDWNILLGGRMDYYSETKDFYFGPRLFTSYKATPEVTLKSAFSKNYQFVREITHYTRLREPIDIFMLTTDDSAGSRYPFGTSTNIMAGATFLKNNWAVDLEFYHKNIGGVIEHTQLVVGQQSDQLKPSEFGYQILNGRGESYGMDLSLGFEEKGYAAWLAYTLSKTNHQFDRISNGDWFPAQDDRRHQLKFSNEYKLNDWTFFGSYVYGSGRNFIDLGKIEGAVDLRVTSIDQVYSKLNPYSRVDLGFSYGFDLLQSRASVSLKVLNALNNDNVDYIQYLFTLPRRRNNEDASSITGSTTQLLDRTFNLSFEFEW